MKNIYLLLSLSFFALSAPVVRAQISFTNAANAYTQNFDAIGTSATATLPSSWRVSKNNVSTGSMGTYGAGTAATEQISGNNMLSTAVDGIYNFGAGISSSATDRCIGALSSLTGTKSMSLYMYLKNNGSSSINDFLISYNVEKYRNGTNVAGFTVQMYYSADGVMWIDAGNEFKISVVGGDVDNNGYASAPQGSTTIGGTLNALLSAGNDMYLAWNYTVTSGTITSNAQALGIDDISVTANYTTTTPVTFSGFDASVVNNQAKINWTTYNEIDMQGYELEKSSDGIKFSNLASVPSYNNSSTSKYSYTDVALFSGNNFYRIKSVEKSGYVSYSKSIKVFVGKQSGITVNPTIVNTGSFNLQMNNISKGQYQMAVYNDAGVPLLNKIISNETQGSMSQMVNLPAGTPKGMYIVRFYGKDANYNQKIMVQ
jgi:hypothetical protein